MCLSLTGHTYWEIHLSQTHCQPSNVTGDEEEEKDIGEESQF